MSGPQRTNAWFEVSLNDRLEVQRFNSKDLNIVNMTDKRGSAYSHNHLRCVVSMFDILVLSFSRN